MKRGLTYAEALEYTGVKRRTFDELWRPRLVAMPQGVVTIFDVHDLDRVFDEFKAQARGDIPPAEPANDSQGPVQHNAARNGRPIQQKGRAPWAKQQGESTPKKTDSGKSINGGRVSDFANEVLLLKARRKTG